MNTPSFTNIQRSWLSATKLKKMMTQKRKISRIWTFDNLRDSLAILNSNKRQMIFESNNLRVFVPFDTKEGEHYVEPVREDLNEANLDHLYNMTVRCEHYINTIVDGKFKWRSISSCSSNSYEAIIN